MDDLDELSSSTPEPEWPYRVWSLLHFASALAFLVYIYLTGPSWPGMMMAFIVGVNVTMARGYMILGDLLARGKRAAAALEEMKENYFRLLASVGDDPDATEPTDRQ